MTRKKNRKTDLYFELERREISPEKFADNVDASLKTVWNWFNGRTKPRRVHKRKIQEFLDLKFLSDVDKLLIVQ